MGTSPTSFQIAAGLIFIHPFVIILASLASLTGTSVGDFLVLGIIVLCSFMLWLLRGISKGNVIAFIFYLIPFAMIVLFSTVDIGLAGLIKEIVHPTSSIKSWLFSITFISPAIGIVVWIWAFIMKHRGAWSAIMRGPASRR